MTYEITLTEQAKRDIAEIFNYIAYDLCSLKNAVGQFTRIQTAIASLDTMPERFRVFDASASTGFVIRVMPVNNYLVFYICSRAEHTVKVIRVLYGRRDIPKIKDSTQEN